MVATKQVGMDVILLCVGWGRKIWSALYLLGTVVQCVLARLYTLLYVQLLSICITYVHAGL